MDEIKKMIMEKLKEQGLEIAEDTAISCAKVVLDLIPMIVLKTENKFDDMLVPILEVVKPKIFDLLDKIDGKEG